MFDMDDLEVTMPSAKAYATTPMRADEFKHFGDDTRISVKQRRFQDFAVSISRALWEEDTMLMRMRKIVQEYYEILDELCREDLPDVEAGSSMLYVLWQLSLSLSMHEVRSIRQAGPVALIIGFGGSHCDDLVPQVEWYKSQGFSVISTCPLHFPVELRNKQGELVAEELRAMLPATGRLVLHLCSHGGCCRAWEMLGRWIKGEPPFADLPPLEKTLAALIFECAPAQAQDATGEIARPPPGILPEEGKEDGAAPEEEKTEPKVEEDEKEKTEPSKKGNDKGNASPESDAMDAKLLEGQVDFYRMVIMGCIGALFTRFIPNVGNLGKLMAAHKDPITRCLRGAARLFLCGLPEWARGGEEAIPAGFWDFEAWDARLKTPIPRLFLYSEKDALVHKSKVEAYYRYSKWYNPKATILTAALKKSQHCKLWGTEKELCVEAVLKLFEHAELRCQEKAERALGA